MMVLEPAAVRFEGISQGTEIWGSTQANFLVHVPPHHAKESAVLLNDPAAALLAEQCGRENTEEFREQAAEAVGRIVFQRAAERGGTIESLVMISKAYFERNPDVAAEVKAALA